MSNTMDCFTVEELAKLRALTLLTCVNCDYEEMETSESDMKSILETANNLVKIKLQSMGLG